MIEFSLSRSKQKALPETVEVDGNAFSVNTSFRTVLRILLILDDDEVVESHKLKLLLERFYVETVPEDIDAAMKAFTWFLHRGDVPEQSTISEAPVFDYEQDAPEIYASFFALYGIDLLDSDMHWWKFCALLDGAFRCDCALSAKIKMRTVDASKCEDPGAVRKAQDSIKIERKMSRLEKQLRENVEAALRGGGDVSAALEELKKHGL